MEPGDVLNRYRDRLDASGVVAALDALDATVRDSGELPGAMPAAAARTPAVTGLARTVLEAADPFLMAEARARAIGSRVATVRSYFISAQGGQDLAIQIDSELDMILDDLALIAAAARVEGGADGVQAVEAMRQEFFRSERQLEREADAVTQGLAALESQRAAIAARQEELRALIEQASADVAAYRTTANADVEQLRTANSTTLSEFRSAFETATAEAVAAGNTRIKTMLDAAETDHAARLAAAAEELTAQKSEAEEALAAIAETEKQVMKVAAALGSGAQSAGWGSYADEQRKAATALLGGAVLSFVVAAGFAVWLAVHAAEAADDASNLSWQHIVSKLTVTTAFALVGGYLAAQSGEHRHQERIARRRHLDLLALPTFIAGLDDEMKHNIVKKLAEEGFLTPDPAPTPKGPRKGLTVSQIGSLFETMSKAK